VRKSSDRETISVAGAYNMKVTLLARSVVGRLTIYMPIVIMGILALGSWWLARNTPVIAANDMKREQRTEPDYFLTQFSLKSFDVQGELTSEVMGQKARHFPATDVLEIEQARFRSSKGLQSTVGQGDRAYSNGDGSEVQLVGNAVVSREARKDAQGRELPSMEIRSEFLHAFLHTEEVKSHKPVTVRRGADVFGGDAMTYNKVEGIVQLDGRVRVQLQSRTGVAAGASNEARAKGANP
jgi:lipopolysaccharide export system protein LptC